MNYIQKKVREENLKWYMQTKCATAIEIPDFKNIPLAPVDAEETQNINV